MKISILIFIHSLSSHFVVEIFSWIDCSFGFLGLFSQWISYDDTKMAVLIYQQIKTLSADKMLQMKKWGGSHIGIFCRFLDFGNFYKFRTLFFSKKCPNNGLVPEKKYIDCKKFIGLKLNQQTLEHEMYLELILIVVKGAHISIY